MQNHFGLLVTDVMPIYMIIPRYSHNYAQFCQLLNSNLFTHRRILMLLREATNETYRPGSILIISISITLILLCFLLCFYFLLCIFIPKNTKNIISIRSHSRKWPWRDWQPHDCVGCEVLACSLLLDWYLGSQKLREILTLLCCITLSSSRENQCMLKR